MGERLNSTPSKPSNQSEKDASATITKADTADIDASSKEVTSKLSRNRRKRFYGKTNTNSVQRMRVREPLALFVLIVLTFETSTVVVNITSTTDYGIKANLYCVMLLLCVIGGPSQWARF